MRSRELARIGAVAALLPPAACFLARAEADRTPSLKLTPPVIEMGLFYSGVKVHIEGTLPPGAKGVVLIRGEGREEVFNKKSRVGPIWVNTGKLRVSGVPSLYLRFSSEPLRAFLSREAIDGNQLDEAAIKKQMRIEPDGDRDAIVAGWLTLKTQDGTYSLVRDAVKMGTPGPAGVPYWVEFQWPKKAPPARYQVWVYECRDRSVINVVSAPLPVVKVGFPAWLAAMATQRAAAYGVAAVLAAVLAGFGIDFLAALVFGRRRATRH